MQALHAPALRNTDTIAINVAPKVSVDALIDLVDAVPQAIGYWVDTYKEVHYTSEATKRIYKLNVIDENTDQEYLISVNTIIEGIQKLITGTMDVQHRYISYILSDLGQGLQGEYIDAETLDLIIQVGLFGEVIYG
jgi:hypothetical protein